MFFCFFSSFDINQDIRNILLQPWAKDWLATVDCSSFGTPLFLVTNKDLLQILSANGELFFIDGTHSVMAYQFQIIVVMIHHFGIEICLVFPFFTFLFKAEDSLLQLAFPMIDTQACTQKCSQGN